ncbi:MAG: CoA-binding protein [Candidatus Zixiibacteriota bacterium]
MEEFKNPSDEKIRELLTQSTTIAVVGLSQNPSRPSYGVANYLKKQNYRIIPVNPTQPEILGEKSYPTLSDIPEKVDIVDIFRRPEFVAPVVEEAIKIKAKAIWMQSGIVNHQAAQKAKEARLMVVMDKCLAVAHSTLK